MTGSMFGTAPPSWEMLDPAQQTAILAGLEAQRQQQPAPQRRVPAPAPRTLTADGRPRDPTLQGDFLPRDPSWGALDPRTIFPVLRGLELPTPAFPQGMDPRMIPPAIAPGAVPLPPGPAYTPAVRGLPSWSQPGTRVGGEPPPGPRGVPGPTTNRPLPEVPPELDPSNVNGTPADRPIDRTNGAQTFEQGSWQDWLAMSSEEGGRRTSAAGAARGQAGEPLETAAQTGATPAVVSAEPPVENPPYSPSAQSPAVPGTPAAGPVDTANVLSAAGPQRAFPGGPDYAAALEAMRSGRPTPLEDAPNERMWRLIAGALSAGYGPDGPAGAPAGLAAAAANEGQRGREMGARNNAQSMEFSRGLAGLLGDQATGTYRAGADAATFDQRERNINADNARASAQLGLQREELGLRREDVGLRREDLAARLALQRDELGVRREDAAARRELAAQSRMMQELRLRMQLRTAGMDVNAQDLLSRALPEAVRNNSPILVTDANGGSSPLMLPVPGEYQGPVRRGEAARELALMTPDRARRAITETLGRDPAYATQAANIPNVANGILSQLYATAISRLPADQQQQALRQLQRWMESRPRSGTTELD